MKVDESRESERGSLGPFAESRQKSSGIGQGQGRLCCRVIPPGVYLRPAGFRRMV